jgi:hypothetical protein
MRAHRLAHLVGTALTAPLPTLRARRAKASSASPFGPLPCRRIEAARIETVSKGATRGVDGMAVLLALAIPAFQETSDDDWLKKTELAVTFLDRYEKLFRDKKNRRKSRPLIASCYEMVSGVLESTCALNAVP